MPERLRAAVFSGSGWWKAVWCQSQEPLAQPGGAGEEAGEGPWFASRPEGEVARRLDQERQQKQETEDGQKEGQ